MGEIVEQKPEKEDDRAPEVKAAFLMEGEEDPDKQNVPVKQNSAMSAATDAEAEARKRECP